MNNTDNEATGENKTAFCKINIKYEAEFTRNKFCRICCQIMEDVTAKNRKADLFN